jgi:hypothetical protein
VEGRLSRPDSAPERGAAGRVAGALTSLRATRQVRLPFPEGRARAAASQVGARSRSRRERRQSGDPRPETPSRDSRAGGPRRPAL